MATVKIIKRKRKTAYQVGFSFKRRRVWVSLNSDFTKADADEVGRLVDVLASSINVNRQLDSKTRAIVEALPKNLKRRLSEIGLISFNESPTLAELVELYFDSTKALAPSTIKTRRHSLQTFLSLVDSSKHVDDFTRADAQNFIQALSIGRAQTTIKGILNCVKIVFNFALNEEMISKTPFKGVFAGQDSNKEREYYVSLDDFQKVLDACTSQEVRAFLSFMRYGGLRAGEAINMEWSRVDFANGRILVKSSKTARYSGKDFRIIPMFPQLRRELEKYFDSLPECSDNGLFSKSTLEYRYLTVRAVFFAGLTLWPRLFQNLRSSRAIEIMREFGSVAESSWLGHSSEVAAKHYLHVLDDDFERAIK